MAGTGVGMSFVQVLRRATAPDHDRVDACYSRFDLGRREDYGRFLTAHARALPAVETALAQQPDLPHWRRRTPLLLADLAALRIDPPAPLVCVLDAASAWGALYVMEGSRLGGQVLARSVSADAPVGYLDARHEAGEWRSLLVTIEERATAADEGWRTRVLEGARACFTLYERAALP